MTDSLESDHLGVISCFDVSVACSSPAFVADLETELVCVGDCLSTDQYNVTLLFMLVKHAPADKSRVTVRKSSPWFGLVREELAASVQGRTSGTRRRSSNMQCVVSGRSIRCGYLTLYMLGGRC